MPIISPGMSVGENPDLAVFYGASRLLGPFGAPEGVVLAWCLVANVIEVESLSKTYGHSRALDHFSLTVPEKMIFGLLGPNGAGKTTAIEIMLGLRIRDEGTVSVLGEDPGKKYHVIAPRVGAMLQQGGINPGLKPREAVSLYSAFYPQSLNVDELLARVDLADVATPVRRLSGGQSQSLSLALAIVGKPDLVFLDEPTTGMDPRARRRTWDIIRELKEQGTSVVLTTHLMDEAELLCDEIAIVAGGRVIAQGDTAALTSSQQDTIDVEFSSDIDSESLADELKVPVAAISSTSVRIEVKPTSEFVLHLAQYAQKHDALISKYNSQAKNLEDVFIELTADKTDSEEK